MKIAATWSLASLLALGVAMPALQIDHAPSIEWTQSTPFPEPRAGYAAGAIDGRLVIAGGTYWEGTKGHWTKKIFSASTHAFDPETQSWEKLPDAPFAFGYAAYTVVDNKLFVLGGYTPSGVNRKILALSRQQRNYVWDIVGDMPEDRLFAQAVGIGKMIYLLGGTTKFEPYDAAGTCCTSMSATNTLMVLDTAQRPARWRQLSPYPGAKRWLFTAETDGKSIWMFGGIFQAEQKDQVTNFNEVLRYQLKNRRWSVMPSLPKETHDATTLSPLFLSGRIILIGSQKKVWQLDLKSFQYQELSPLPEAAYVDKFVWLDNRIVGAGGENSIEGPRRRSEWTFMGKLDTNGNRRSLP